MKKLLFVLAIGAFAACNDNTEKTSTTAADSTAVAPATLDTAATAPMAADTTSKMMDTTSSMMKKDSAAKK